MKLRIPEAEWAHWWAQNADPYSRAVFVYALEWAEAMEAELAKGRTVAEVRELCEPKGHGITGFQYGCAVNVLSNAWEFGEELRKAHNLAHQIRREGERANDAGGVLNPALLVVGGK